MAPQRSQDSLGDDVVSSVLDWKDKGNKLRQHEQFAFESPLDILQRVSSDCIVVDTSASCDLDEVLVGALERGAKVALANKKPLTSEQHVFDSLTEGGRYARLGTESTVGAGTPFMATLRRLLQSGENIKSVMGALSGTLGYVASGLQKGQLLSEVVSDAFNRGYTEPDPRDDLGGIDVARKALIIARTMGIKAEMSDVSVEALYPESFADLPVPEFMKRLPELDADISKRVAEASAEDCVLRYVACLEFDENNSAKLSVGLKSVQRSSALGTLDGTDNLLQLFSDSYSSSPLVVRGAGAGARVTAIGVLADIVHLARVQ